MSFKLENFGADASNVKSILGGANYYRYFNKDNNTLTTPGYFPADLGLAVGDRITVIPQTKTDADEQYIVSDITNRVVTVTKVEAGLDTSKVVNADVLPTAGADNLGYFYLYTGATDANYTHGYIYENKKTSTYTDSVTFEPATLSGTVVTATAGALSSLCAEYITGDITSIVSGTLVYLAAGDLWLLTGKDAEDNTVGSFQVYTPDYEAAGFTFTGTPVNGDVIAFTCTIEETGATYAWVRQDVQPQPAKELPSQTGNTGKFLTTDGTNASWSDKPLTNNTTRPGSVAIIGSSQGNYSVGIGTGAQSTGNSSVAIGFNTATFKDGTVAIGKNAQALGEKCIGICGGTDAQAVHAIQLGCTDSTYTNNTDSNTFKVANANGNFQLMSADGTIPADRLASTTGLADGNYKPRLTISGGVATITWVAE